MRIRGRERRLSRGQHRDHGPAAEVEVRHPGGELYGSDRVMLELVTAWTRKGHGVSLALGEAGPLEGELTRRGLDYELIPMPVLRGEILRPRRLPGFLRDIIHDLGQGLKDRQRGRGPARYISTLTMPSQVIASRLAGRHTVLHVHEAEISRPRLVRAVLSASALCANTVIANSRFTKDVLLDSWPHLKDKVEVVYNPIDVPSPMPMALPSRRPEELKLLYLGRLSERKGVDLAVRTVIELLNRGLPVQLTIVGSAFRGNEDFEIGLRKLVAINKVDNKIRFQGFVPHVGSFVAENHMVMVPSQREESYGNVAAEAALAGRFVAVADHTGLHEVTNDLSAALRVSDMTPVAWADAITDLWERWEDYQQLIESDQQTLKLRHDPITISKMAADCITMANPH